MVDNIKGEITKNKSIEAEKAYIEKCKSSGRLVKTEEIKLFGIHLYGGHYNYYPNVDSKGHRESFGEIRDAFCLPTGYLRKENHLPGDSDKSEAYERIEIDAKFIDKKV